MTVNDKRKPSNAPTEAPGHVSLDRKGVWYFSNAFFPLEDPTHAGTGKPLPRFLERAFTQSEETSWADGQWRAGVFKKFDGHPADEGTKELVYVEPVATPAIPVGEAVTKVVDPAAAEAEAEAKALAAKEAAEKEAAEKQAAANKGGQNQNGKR